MANTLEDALLELEQFITDNVPGVQTLNELLRNVDRLTDRQTTALANLMLDITQFELNTIGDITTRAAVQIGEAVDNNANRIVEEVQQSEGDIRNTVLHTSQLTYDKLDSIENSIAGITDGFADMTETLVESFGDDIEMLATDLTDEMRLQTDALVLQIQQTIDEVFGGFGDIFDTIDLRIEELNTTISESNAMLVSATEEQTEIIDERLDNMTRAIVKELDESSDQITSALNAQTLALTGAEAASTTAIVAAITANTAAISASGTAQATASVGINTTIAGAIAAVTAWLAANAIDPDFSIEKFLGEVMSEVMQAQFKVAQQTYEDFDRDIQ